MKWSQSSDRVRIEVIGQIVREASLVAGVSACVIDKQWINTTLARRREEVRYNYALRFALEKGGLFDASTRNRKIHLAIDARNRRATDTLIEYVELLMANEEIASTVTVTAYDSARSPQLQAADFVVGSIYSAYAHGDWRYLNALRDGGIRIELRVLKKKAPAP